MMTKPKFYRKSVGNRFGWEIYSRKSFFLTISIGSTEIQINRWPENVEFERCENH